VIAGLARTADTCCFLVHSFLSFSLCQDPTMAFDHPIEADRIDDLGLFSAFIRAPVVGTLMWVLGGSKAMEEEEKEKELMLIDGEDDGTSTSRSTRHVLNMEEVNGKLKKTAPRLIGSDISEFGECAAEAEALALQRSSSLRRSSSKGLRKSRKMSWSDESGQNLCEYIEEVSFSSTFTGSIVFAVTGEKVSLGILCLFSCFFVMSCMHFSEFFSRIQWFMRVDCCCQEAVSTFIDYPSTRAISCLNLFLDTRGARPPLPSILASYVSTQGLSMVLGELVLHDTLYISPLWQGIFFANAVSFFCRVRHDDVEMSRVQSNESSL